MAKLNELIHQFRTELGTDLIAAVVVGTDGLSIAGEAIDPNFSDTDASARLAMVMKLASKACNKVGVGKVEDNLSTTDKTYVIARAIGDGSYFWGVVVTRNATLGSVRMVMNEYVDQLWDAIPH
ncbi:MAG: roadblock/LC7 domain-containing protein [Anaerolineaceae bacterium]